MKLLVHNFLSSRFLKNVNVGYPLKLTANIVNSREQEFNPEFISRMMPKLEYGAFREAARAIGHGEDLPEQAPRAMETTTGSGDGGGGGDEASASATSTTTVATGQEIPQYDESFLKAIHRNLLELEIVEGFLECPESGRQFPIKNGIPNMLANEDEVK